MGNTIVGIGSVPVTGPSSMAPTPVLIQSPSGKLTMRARGPALPTPTAQGALCWPVSTACFTSPETKDRAKMMCRSGERPHRDPGRGCPAGASRIDTYGSYSETSASQFDPCLIQDFPVCFGDERFRSTSRQYAVGDTKSAVMFHGSNVLGIVLGIGVGYAIGKWVFKW